MIQIANIRSKLKTAISNINSSTQVAYVYDYYEANVAGYPSIVFDISDTTDAFFTNKENIMRITFTAYVIVEIPNNKIQDATALLDSITDTLIVELRKESNLTLDGSIDYMLPSIGPRGETSSPNGQIFSQQLDIALFVAGLVN